MCERTARVALFSEAKRRAGQEDWDAMDMIESVVGIASTVQRTDLNRLLHQEWSP